MSLIYHFDVNFTRKTNERGWKLRTKLIILSYEKMSSVFFSQISPQIRPVVFIIYFELSLFYKSNFNHFNHFYLYTFMDLV